MLQIVATRDLKLGMFVAELDRPWLGTPFLMQGFLIEDDGQLVQVQDLCRFVTVDRVRSVGAEYVADPASAIQPTRRPKSSAQAKPVVHYQGRKRLAIPPLVMGVVREVGGRRFSAVSYPENVRVEEELPVARVVYENGQRLIEDLGEQVSTGQMPDIDHVDRTVGGMVECVVRNPDAMIWLARLKRTDNETYHHSLNVSIHLMAFGRHLGLPPDELHSLGMGGLLKDIGFIRLPSSLLQKSGGLTSLEREQMRQHVHIGAELLANEFTIAEDVRDIIIKHHERIDGSGYPARLRGDELGLYAEMAGLADSYCAMSYPRSFRPARNSQWMIEEINTMRDLRFTASVVDEFVQFIGLYPVGTLVELNSGEVGVVYEQNRVRRLKPRIMLLLGPDKSPNPSPGIINLLLDPLICEGKPYQIVRTLPTGSFGLDPKEFYL